MITEYYAYWIPNKTEKYRSKMKKKSMDRKEDDREKKHQAMEKMGL